MNSDDLARLYESIRNAPEGTSLEFSGAEKSEGGDILWQVKYAITPGAFMTLEVTKQVVLQDDVDGIIDMVRDSLHDWPPEDDSEDEEREEEDEEHEEEDEEPPEKFHDVGDDGWSEPVNDEEAEELSRVQEMLRMYGGG